MFRQVEPEGFPGGPFAHFSTHRRHLTGGHAPKLYSENMYELVVLSSDPWRLILSEDRRARNVERVDSERNTHIHDVRRPGGIRLAPSSSLPGTAEKGGGGVPEHDSSPPLTDVTIPAFSVKFLLRRTKNLRSSLATKF